MFYRFPSGAANGILLTSEGGAVSACGSPAPGCYRVRSLRTSALVPYPPPTSASASGAASADSTSESTSASADAAEGGGSEWAWLGLAGIVPVLCLVGAAVRRIPAKTPPPPAVQTLEFKELMEGASAPCSPPAGAAGDEARPSGGERLLGGVRRPSAVACDGGVPTANWGEAPPATPAHMTSGWQPSLYIVTDAEKYARPHVIAWWALDGCCCSCAHCLAHSILQPCLSAAAAHRGFGVRGVHGTARRGWGVGLRGSHVERERAILAKLLEGEPALLDALNAHMCACARWLHFACHGDSNLFLFLIFWGCLVGVGREGNTRIALICAAACLLVGLF